MGVLCIWNTKGNNSSAKCIDNSSRETTYTNAFGAHTNAPNSSKSLSEAYIYILFKNKSFTHFILTSLLLCVRIAYF